MQDKVKRHQRDSLRTSVLGTVRVGPLMRLPALLRELGCAPEVVLHGAGLKPELFDHPDNELSYAAGGRLLAHCARVTGCPHFGLLLGERARLASLGVAGFLAQSAPDAGTALRSLLAHQELHDTGSTVALRANSDVALVDFTVHHGGVQGVEQIGDMAAAVIYNVMRELCGPAWCATEILLSRQDPPDATPYHKVFQAPVRFGTGRTAVAFRAAWLDQPMQGANSFLHEHLKQEAVELHARRSMDLVGNVRRVVAALLAARECTASSVAGRLGMHERTLHRRLRAEQTSFRHQVHDVRYQIAKQMLSDGGMSLADIAAALGYADVTAFNRAFKRWSDTTPMRWRGPAVSKR